MLESEAQEKAIQMIGNRKRIFCPMIKENCLISCECFKMPEIINGYEIPKKDSYYVKGGFCKAYCLNGPEY